TLDEAKLLEKALAAVMAEEGKGPSSPPTHDQMPGESAEVMAPSAKSLWDCVISISPNNQAEADATMQASDSTASLGEQRGSMVKLTAQVSQQKLRSDEEQARNDEQRTLLWTHWELEVSLGDLAEASRAAGNNCVTALARDPLPPVVAAVDAVYQILPSICFLLKDHTMQKLELLRPQLFDRLPFLRESVQDAGRKVILPKTLAQEAVDAAMGLGGGQTGGRELTQPVGEEVMHILGQIATEYAFQTMDEAPVEPYALHETRVTTMEITRLLQRLTLLCRFADRLRERTGQIYASDVRRFGQMVQQELTYRDEVIATAMTEMRAQGHATWPTRRSELVAVSGIAAHLPRTQSEQFLSVAQLGALVQTFLDWELTELIAANGFGGGSIASDVFVALVLQVATNDAFPERWRDPRAVAGVSLQQSSSHGFVSWRKFVWTLLCIQFVGLPLLEEILEYQAQALKAIEAQGEDQSTLDGVALTSMQFWELPLWFERPDDTQPTRTEQDVETLKRLVFHLFAAASLSSEIDAGAASRERVQLLPMLLCWCVHPSCSFGVRQELSEFLPRYPRGLLRAFHLLCNHSTAHQSEAKRVSALFAVAGVSASADDQQQRVNCFVSDAAVDFPSFFSACGTDLERFFVLQNPLEALVQP
ncbi:hypothetical protein BBJ28_00021907, partial [Nothophytophthora sp. Chile5]